MTSCAGLKTQTRIIPESRAVKILKAGEKFEAPTDGVFVGQALYVDLNEALLRCREKQKQ